MKNIKLLLVVFTLLSFNSSIANDKYKKHNEIQYSKYYEQTDSVLFNSTEFSTCSTSTRVTKTLYLTSNPTCEAVAEQYYAELFLDFRIGQEHYNFGKNYGQEFTISCLVDVILKGSPDIQVLTNHQLTIKYDPSTNKLFYPQEIKKIKIDPNLYGYTGIEVSLVQQSINVSAPVSEFNLIESKIKSQIQLEAFYKINHKYNTSSVQLLNINSSYIIGNNVYNYIDTLENLDFRMVKLAWEVNGCEDFEFEKYQIQILKLSNTISDLDGFKDNQFDVNTIVDWSEAISIEVGDYRKYIDIFLTQGKGVYTWRVRPIGNYYSGGIANSQNWGKWNIGSIDDGEPIVYNHEVDYFSADFFRMYINESIDDDLNWVHSRVFNESDESASKFYDEITYSDDLLGKRQYQKKVNSTDDNLTAEYYPDFHGNSVLSSLFAPISSSLHLTNNNIAWSLNYLLSPAPEHGSNLLYKRATLLNGTDKYSFANFGTDKTSDVVNGGHIYDYYDESSEKGIPSSEGYPYTKSIYYNDGTNRLKEQRLPGPISYTNTSGMGKIRTFYATATEKELVALFGKEAPNPQKVFKVINIDQNNVYHYTYKGVDGKVIATAYRNIATQDLLAINNNSGHSYEIIDKEYYITDYYPVSNNNLITYKEEKKEFIEDGSQAQVMYSIRNRPFDILNICSFSGNNLTTITKKPAIDVDIEIVVSDNGNYNANPTVIQRSTTTNVDEYTTTAIVPTFALPSTEPTNYKFSRTISFDSDDIDTEVNNYKNSIATSLRTNIFTNEINYLNGIINAEPGKSIEQFRKNLVPPTTTETQPNLDWGWKDVNGNSVSEGDPTSDGNFTKFIPSVGDGCNNFRVHIPQNICNTSSSCYLEKDKYDNDDYERMIIQIFASREVYENGGSDIPLELDKIEDYFWEPVNLSDENIDIKRFIPKNGPYFDPNSQNNEGVFNQMIVNMLAEEYESEHYINTQLNQGMENQKIWTKEEVCDCWNTAIDQFQARGIIEDEETGREVINPKFSLMDAFLSCTGTMFKGYSNTPFENDKYCNQNIPSNPLDNEGTFQVCYDHPENDTNMAPLKRDGIRNPDIVLFGGGYFENAYKYLPLFINQGKKDNIYSYLSATPFTAPCPCNASVTGDFNDNYKINLNPEYDDYNGLDVDDPKNLDFYYKFAGNNNNKTIGKIQEDADFYFTDYTYFRNEYKRVYDDWHYRTTYINFASDKGDNTKGKDKRNEMPPDNDPCNQRAQASKTKVMTDVLKSSLGSDFELPDCMKCGSQSECDMSDITDFLYQYVDMCENSCDTKGFRKALEVEFHTNPDAYYVLQGDEIRTFDFGTYKILNSTQMQKVRSTDPPVDMSSYNIIYVTETEISKYEATLLANCMSDCQPKCFDPVPKKYANSESDGLEGSEVYKQEGGKVSISSKPIETNDELAFDTDCLLEDIARIMKVISSSFEIQLPKIDCDGNPSYCETGEKNNWKTLNTNNRYEVILDESLNEYKLSINPKIYSKELVNKLNVTLREIKSYVESELSVDNTDIMNSSFIKYIDPMFKYPIVTEQEERYWVYMFSNLYKSMLYSAIDLRIYACEKLNETIQNYDPRIKIFFDCLIDTPKYRWKESVLYTNSEGDVYKYNSIKKDLMEINHPKHLLSLPDVAFGELMSYYWSIEIPYHQYRRTDYGLNPSYDINDLPIYEYRVKRAGTEFAFPPNFEEFSQVYENSERFKYIYGLPQEFSNKYNEKVKIFDFFDFDSEKRYIYLNRHVYNAFKITTSEFWNNNMHPKVYKLNFTNGEVPNKYNYKTKVYSDFMDKSFYNIQKTMDIVNPAQLSKSDERGRLNVKSEFTVIPILEIPESYETFCFRWVSPGEDEFDQPFEQELIVNDCEFNEPDMYLELIENQIEDIAYNLAEEYRGKILESLKEYVYGADNDETDDLDELKVVLPAESATKFTLYYYDHHGNLVKTVPPKGVNVDLNRDRDDLAVHDMETMYQYNSIGQLVASKSADQSTDKSVNIGSVSCDYDGETVYIYDLAGRLRFTVNSNQMEGKKRNEVNYPLATYYKYDKRSRLIETGEMHTYFANYDLETTPEYFTVGDYLRWYLDMKEMERTNPTDKETAKKFYKYQRQFSEILLENLDFPSDKDPAGNFVYTSFINPLYNSGSLSSLNHLYRPIKLKIITTYDSPQTLPFVTDYRIDGVAPTQKYLRNRISNITRIPDSEWEDGSFFPNRVDSYYSYDPHGNVDWYYQYIQPHKTNAVQYGMLTHYEYDLISGNVTQIHYQPGKVDEFTQIYDYDADNRLTEVNTTRFGILKETDARYKYYKHGPLKRKEYGSDYVQGMDYYYTIQGWLKGINDVNMNDYNGWDKLGGDALTTINRKYAYDAFAMSLNYYDGDFVTNANNDFVHKVGTLHKELYNGNISSWEQVHSGKYNLTPMPNQEIKDVEMMARINEFEYDISGRLIISEILKTTSTGTTPLTGAPERYSSGYDYDLNGNIEDISRYDDNMSSANLTTQSSTFSSYTDNSSRVRPMNRLAQVSSVLNGIPSGISKNYIYDNMGNILTKFDSNNPNSDFHIIWTADGKIDTVIKFITVPNKVNHSIPETYVIKTSYYYDGMGNKVMTITEPEAAMEHPIGLRCNGDGYMLTLYDNCVECIEALGLKATYYGREAGGKTLALYDTDPPINDANGVYSCQVNYTEIWLDDWYVYGSEADGRIATVDPKEVIEGSGKRMTDSEFSFPVNTVGSPIDTLKVPIAMRGRGINGVTGTYQTQQRIPDFRRYEIKDHLGNVRTVIADYKNPDPTYTSSPIQFWRYFADVKNISNMYPYGKSYGTNAIYNAAEDYRYGFNGMEKEKNMDASGDITDFGARVFDANFPMFLSPDPLKSEFSNQSVYVFAGNNPIKYIDINGLARYYSYAGEYMGSDGQNDNKLFITQLCLPNEISISQSLHTQSFRHTIEVPLLVAREDFVKQMDEFTRSPLSTLEYETASVFRRLGELVRPALSKITEYSDSEQDYSSFDIKKFLHDQDWSSFVKYAEKLGISLIIHSHPAFDINPSDAKDLFDKKKGTFFADDLKSAKDMMSQPFGLKTFGIISSLYKYDDPSIFNKIEIQFYDDQGSIGRIILENWLKIGTEAGAEKSGGQSNESD